MYPNYPCRRRLATGSMAVEVIRQVCPLDIQVPVTDARLAAGTQRGCKRGHRGGRVGGRVGSSSLEVICCESDLTASLISIVYHRCVYLVFDVYDFAVTN